MKLKIPKISFSLLRNFLLSTLIPFIVITVLISSLYRHNYKKDISTLVDTSMISLSKNLEVYLMELNRATLMPYYNEDFFSIIKKIKNSPSVSTLDTIQLENSIGYLMSFIRYTRDDIVSSIIVSDNRCLYNTSSILDSTVDSNYNFGKETWYQEAIRLQGQAVFIPPHTLPYLIPERNTEVISVARAIINLRTREPICVMKVDANAVIFDKIFQEIKYHVPSHIMVTDSNHQTIYTNSPSKQLLPKSSLEADKLLYHDTEYLVHKQTIEPYGWNLYILLDAATLNRNTMYIYMTSISLYILGAIIAFILYLIRSRNMLSAINTINTMLLEIQDGNLRPKCNTNTSQEFQFWINSINNTALLLEEKIQQEYQLSLEQKTYQFKALQAQINPHFLFNTLNGFLALNRLDKKRELEQALYSLTHMLRYSLGEQEQSTLKEELAFLDNYCALQKLRFGSRLSYTIHCTNQLEHIIIPKLILQPLVENAIIHGIEPLQRDCSLDVDIIEVNPQELLITIEDDGFGFDVSGSIAHIGLDNVIKRLKLLNPQNELTIESIPDEGTIVTITLHLQKG